MYPWTAPLPATPTLTAVIPAVPTESAPIPAVPAAVIAASTIPYIEPQVNASFSGAGAIALPYLPSQVDGMAASGIGVLQAVSAAVVPETATLAGAGALAAPTAVKSGTVIITAGFAGTGSFVRDDAPFSAAGELSMMFAPIAILLAAFYGVGVDSGGTTWPAAFNGVGVLSGPVTPKGNTASTGGGIGALSAGVAVSGDVAVAAAFGGVGVLSGAETGMSAHSTAGFASAGTLSALVGGSGTFAGLGALSVLLGAPATFAATGTGAANVAFGALFGSAGSLAMITAPQARFSATGSLSAVASVSGPLAAQFSGAGTFTAVNATAVTAGFTGLGALYGTDYVELNASGSGSGSASVAVVWSEAEGGAFSATGTLTAIAVPLNELVAYAMTFEEPLWPALSRRGVAMGVYFEPLASAEQ